MNIIIVYNFNIINFYFFHLFIYIKKMNYYDIIILIILIVIIFYIRYIKINNYNEYFINNEITTSDKFEINMFLEILTIKLNNNNITYWIIGGTLLGSVRHGELIPWDDDADIGIFDCDLNRLLDLNKEFNKLGYEIVPFWKIYKFRKIGTTYPFIDVFCYYIQDTKYVMNDIELQQKWPNEYYYHDELFPLKSYQFGLIYVNGPNYPLAYLNRMYPKWEFYAEHTFDHKNSVKTSKKINLDPSNPEHLLRPYIYLTIDNTQIESETFLKNNYDKYHNKNIIIIN